MQYLSKLFLCQLASLFKEVASPTCQHAFPAAVSGAWSCHTEPHPAQLLLHALACLCTDHFPSLLFIFPLSSVSLCGQGCRMVTSKDVLVSGF